MVVVRPRRLPALVRALAPSRQTKPQVFTIQYKMNPLSVGMGPAADLGEFGELPDDLQSQGTGGRSTLRRASALGGMVRRGSFFSRFVVDQFLNTFHSRRSGRHCRQAVSSSRNRSAECASPTQRDALRLRRMGQNRLRAPPGLSGLSGHLRRPTKTAKMGRPPAKSTGWPHRATLAFSLGGR